jgi:hypothetical protein
MQTCLTWAQTYYPMLDPVSNDWYFVSAMVPVRLSQNAVNCAYGMGPWTSFSYKSTTTGDTVIGGNTYRKLEEVNTFFPGNDCFFGYLREDTASRKIYFMDHQSGPETVLYDFSMQVGDSISLDFVNQGYYQNGYFTVDSIGLISIPAGTRRIFFLNNHGIPWPTFYPLEWIEGVGHPGHLVYTHSANSYGGAAFFMCQDQLPRDYYQSLSCFEHAAQKVFFDSCAHAEALNNMCFDYQDSCNYWNICGSVSEHFAVRHLSVIPNPSSGPVQIRAEAVHGTQGVVRISEVRGKSITEQPVVLNTGTNTFELPVSGYDSGIYIVELSLPGGSLFTKLIHSP